MQLLRIYHVHKTTWPWASLKVHKGNMKVNVKLVWDFDVDNITINLQHDKTIYCIHRVPDAASSLSAYMPSQWQYPSSLRGLRGKKVSCFQTSRPFLMRHTCGTFQKSSLGVEDFSGALILPFIGLPDFANPPDVAKI